MNEKRQERVESAIVYLIGQFPGLLGPMAIQAGIKAVFHIPDAECAPIEDNLAFLESLGLLIRRDSDRGYPVFQLSDRGWWLLPHGRPRIHLKTAPAKPAAAECVGSRIASHARRKRARRT